MTTEAKPSSRAGSKTNLNESTMPLLLVEEENKVVHKDPAGKDVSKGSAETFEMKETKGDVEEGKINVRLPNLAAFTSIQTLTMLKKKKKKLQTLKPFCTVQKFRVNHRCSQP
jgi:hypothetical protein